VLLANPPGTKKLQLIQISLELACSFQITPWSMIPAQRRRHLARGSLRGRGESDGYIAGPNGEADWIIMDPDIDFNEIFSQFDTLLIGRKTFDAMKGMGGGYEMPGMSSFVFSRTLRQQDHPKVRIVAENGVMDPN
jgi:hypothetical protein